MAAARPGRAFNQRIFSDRNVHHFAAGGDRRLAMYDIANQLAEWAAAGERFAVATVIGVRGSAPREPGAALAVHADGRALGSVSGGCVEGAVYELAQRALAQGRRVSERFGSTDDDPFAAGLTCGGELEIFVQPVVPSERPGVVAALGAV